ncbi:hypothetical protein SADUNF_Sadunf08G0029300 [Salix dunnii]|uniref:Uncharacterized protein n=1 Tax=Salix dunnii TaxID=1413687 RepID=A0A835JXB5_9ROSI|nr:hypothetical protein SADUNF_Sadunf08G0029300 [Salix dunnii]
MGHWRLKPTKTAVRLRQPKTGGKGGMLRIPARFVPSLSRLKRCPPQETHEFTAMPVAAENASVTMVESTSVGATAIAAKLILFLSRHSLNPIGSGYIFFHFELMIFLICWKRELKLINAQDVAELENE